MELEKQIADAIQRREPLFRGVQLPLPQVSGTATQNRTYAILEARRIITDNNL